MRIGWPAAVIVVVLLAGCADRSPVAPEPSAPSVAVLDAGVSLGAARVTWQVRNGEGLPFVILRRHADQPFKTRATLTPDADGRMALADAAVLPGEPYTYGVRIPGRPVDEVHATVTVEVPGPLDP